MGLGELYAVRKECRVRENLGLFLYIATCMPVQGDLDNNASAILNRLFYAGSSSGKRTGEVLKRP